MTDVHSARLAELRAVAEAATEGSWEAHDRGIGFEVHRADGQPLNWKLRETFDEQDAAHIAAFDPPTVLALIAALEAKTAEVVQAEAAAKHATGRMIDARALLQQMADRIDPFVFDELASELDDQPLDANGDTFEHRLDRAEAALERVKALHEKKESEALTGECADETCEHEDTCPTQPFEVCIACWDLCEESDPYFGERGISQVLYPCPTIRALETGADQ